MKVRELKILLLKGLVLALPFGWWSPFPIPYTNLTFLFIYVYLALSFLTFRESFSRSLVRIYALPLLLIWVIMLITTNKYYNENAETANSVLRQFIFFSVFFAFGLKDNLVMAARGEHLYGYFLVAVGAIILAFFGGMSQEFNQDGRLTLAVMNPNMVAMYCAGGFLVLMDSLLNKNGTVSRKLVRQIAVLGLIGFAAIITLTGSRGGIVILTAALVVYFATWTRMSPKKLSLIIPVGILAFSSMWLMASSGVMYERMTVLDEDVRLTVLWPAGLEIVKQYPFFGAGLGRVEEIVMGVTRTGLVLHNEYLKVATSAGLVGLFLFFLVLKRLFNNALRWRQVTGSGLQLAMLALVALFLGKGGGALAQPFVWVIFLLLSGPPITRDGTNLRSTAVLKKSEIESMRRQYSA